MRNIYIFVTFLLIATFLTNPIATNAQSLGAGCYKANQTEFNTCVSQAGTICGLGTDGFNVCCGRGGSCPASSTSGSSSSSITITCPGGESGIDTAIGYVPIGDSDSGAAPL